MEGPSHVVFGIAGAVAADSVLHITQTQLIGGVISPDAIALKIVFYGFAALGAIAPDIDNARSMIGQRLGPVSRAVQHVAGHRTFFHSLLGLAFVAELIWLAQYALGQALYNAGLQRTGESLGSGLGSGPTLIAGQGVRLGGVAFSAFIVGYFLHLVADSLTYGGVPWLWPLHERFGFPPDKRFRFRTGSRWEPVVVTLVSVAALLGVVTGKLYF